MINEGKSTEIVYSTEIVEIVNYKELGDGFYPYPDLIIYIYQKCMYKKYILIIYYIIE